MNHEAKQKAILGPLKYQFPNRQLRRVVIANLVRLLSLMGRSIRRTFDRTLVFHSDYLPVEWRVMLPYKGVR